MTKMNPEVKAKWVAALRSGEYKQTKDRLKDGSGHCCLGVLCDIFAKERGKPWTDASLSEAGPGQSYDDLDITDAGLPGAVVCIWAGFDPQVEVKIGRVRKRLYNHNDDNATFAEIADAIEEQL